MICTCDDHEILQLKGWLSIKSWQNEMFDLASYHSWRNPVEHVMSILNLRHQCVGLAHAEMPKEFENEVSKCNILLTCESISKGKSWLCRTVSPVKVPLCQIFSRLKLHDEEIHTFTSASTEELSEFWSAIIAVDATLTENGVYRQETINQHQKALEYIQHCCQSSHYTFDILRCGKSSCSLCSPVHLPVHIFKRLCHMPHPVPGEDGHYLNFSEVFGIPTTEEYRPSFKKQPSVPLRETRENFHTMPVCSM